jgi:hypothetical protein
MALAVFVRQNKKLNSKSTKTYFCKSGAKLLAYRGENIDENNWLFLGPTVNRVKTGK